MTEPVFEVIDATSVGAHSHPHDHPHEHQELAAEMVAIRGEMAAMAMVEVAAQAAQGAEVAAEVAVEETYDVRADVESLREEMRACFEELRGQNAVAPEPIVINDAPMEPEIEAPPVTEHQPHKRKQSGLSWF